MIDFESPKNKTNREITKALDRFTRLQIGVERVNGGEGTFTYPSAFFLPAVFENSSDSFIEYSTITF